MSSIKDLFGDLSLDKPVTIELDGRELELEMRVEDLHSLMVMGQSERVEEDEVQMLTDTLRTILYRTYMPHYDKVRDQFPEDLSKEQQKENEEVKQYVEGLLLKYYIQMFISISEELGWQDEGAMQGVGQQDFPAREGDDLQN